MNYEKEIEILKLKVKTLELELKLADEMGKVVQPYPVSCPRLVPEPPFIITCWTSGMSGYNPNDWFYQ